MACPFADAVGPAAFVTYIRAILLRDTGATISPFNAFLLLQGVETLSLRLERHAENTKKVVAYLAHHPQVEHVNHPSLPEHPDHALYEKYFPNGGASIFTFNIKGGQKEAHKFIDSLKNLFSPGERRGREEPCHSPGNDDAFPADGRRAGGSGHCAEHDSPVHRHGTHRRHYCGLAAGV